MILIQHTRPGGGRVDAEYAHLYGLGSDTFPAWNCMPLSKDKPVRMIDSLVDRCGSISISAGNKSKPVRVEFIRSRWINSVAPLKKIVKGTHWGQFALNMAPGSSGKLVLCDLDGWTYLKDVSGFSIEDCVFRNGVHGVGRSSPLTSFKRNIIRWEAHQQNLFHTKYGDTLEDCIFIHDFLEHNNPHFHFVSQGTGTAHIKGCLYWFSGPNTTTYGPEGDGPAIGNAKSGTPKDNKCIIERCIYMPNSHGPDKDRNLSCNITSGIMGTSNSQIIIRRNTAFTQGVSLGETITSHKGAITYMKSNLFVGSPNSKGSKMNDYGHGEEDVIRAEDADYNAGYRLKLGSNYVKGKTGKGYHRLKLSNKDDIGKHDIDDVDPQFVDANRNPLTWSKSLGGDGTMADAMNQLKPTGTHDMQKLLDYIREGFRPQNPKLKGAGDPESGSPDIGAVEML